jgi:large subunit ribosomal protein L4
MSETSRLQAAAFTAQGVRRQSVQLPPLLFDGKVNVPVMHRAVKAFLANQRQGNASTKNRRWVTGGNQKPWRQKGTGRARQGSIRSPLWPGGGTVFGPTPRSYEERLPRKMKALARKSAFNARARENAIFVIDSLDYERPHTKTLVQLLERLGVPDSKVLILTDGSKPNVYLSARNVPGVAVLPYTDASTYHLLWSDVVLIEATALGQELQPAAEAEAQPVQSEQQGKAKVGRSRSKRGEPGAESSRAATPKKRGAERGSATGASAQQRLAGKKAAGATGKAAAKAKASLKKSASRPARKGKGE